MRIFFPILCNLALWSCAATAPVPRISDSVQAGETTAESHARAVENGLLPPVLIRGAPRPRMNIEERMRFYNAPGLSIAVINNGQIEWARGYGVRRNGEPAPVTPETLFAAGSVSKPVAAMAALRLVQEGRLELDQNVNERLTSWQVPENPFTLHEKVTLRRILNHTSGLPTMGGDGRPSPARDMVAALSGDPPRVPPVQPEFTPGARQRYSNGAYGLLGLLLQDVSGVPTAQLFGRTVLEPLGMTNSVFTPLTEAYRTRAAFGHNSRSGEPQPHETVYSPALGASGLWTTPSDLARFVIELQRARAGNGQVLSQDMARLMTVPSRNGWSLGLNVNAAGDTPYFYHDGSVPGFTTYMVAFNTRGQGAIVMVNQDAYSGLRLLHEVMLGIADVYHWEGFAPIERATIAARPERYSDYEGTYEIDEGYPVTIVARDRRLYLIWALGSLFEMHQEGPDAFFIVRDAAPVFTFQRDQAGHVTGVSRRWYGGEATAPRVPLPPVSQGAETFRLEGHQDALVVSLVGAFNDWRLQRNLCARERGGWSCRADLAAGEQHYAFLVDGRQLADPARPGGSRSPDGEPASVVRIGR